MRRELKRAICQKRKPSEKRVEALQKTSALSTSEKNLSLFSMLEVMMAIEKIDGRSPDTLDLMLLESLAVGLSRQTAIWALLPWPQGARYAADLVRLRAARTGARAYDEIIEF